MDTTDRKPVSFDIDKHKTGATIEVQVTDLDGKLETHQVTLIQFPDIDIWAYVVTPYGIGITYLLTGLWVFGLRRRDA
ncbi:MAG: hypothetical protein MUC31_08245, partial [Bacteroidales bacterium]|nr:hypothetical protein [Bacteroidales bacterium]